MSAGGTILKHPWGASKTLATSGMKILLDGSEHSGEETLAVPVDMSRLVLDSTVLIDALRGRPAAERIKRLRRVGVEPWVSPISIEEIWRGLRFGEEPNARRLVRALRLAPLRAADAQRAGGWRREFASRGITLHQADCLIAASAVGVGAALATANMSDFPMPELEVQHWPMGV